MFGFNQYTYHHFSIIYAVTYVWCRQPTTIMQEPYRGST